VSANPMQQARAALALHPRCGAHCRTTGESCRNAAMPNGRCRMHGGMSPGAPQGRRNPSYRHGRRTIESKTARRQIREALAGLRDLLGSQEG
jgi:hypothetical protein